MSRLYLRVDDFPGSKPAEFDRHNLDNFRRFDEVVTRHVPSYVLGVIPRHTTDEHLRWFRDNRHVEVALHGIDHDERFPNEFRDHQTVADRYQALATARARLRDSVGSDVDLYIPPHNVIDNLTVAALDAAGFRTVWGGPETDVEVLCRAHVKYRMHVHRFMPPLEYGRSDELLERGSIGHFASRYVDHPVEDPLHLGLHWPWEWNIGLDSLDRYLSELAEVLHIHGRTKHLL